MAKKSLLSDISIVGVGRTTMAKQLEMNTLEACLEAVQLALVDAGLEIQDIDGISARWPGPGGTTFLPGSSDWSKLLGIPLRWIGDTYPQGIPAVLAAAGAIITGQCETVLIVGGQAGILGGGSVAPYTRPDNEFISAWGSITQAQFALVAQIYLSRFRPDRTKLASLAADIRNSGSKNPNAVMKGRGPYSAEDILSSPMIASPLHLLEVCLATEGAAAVIITSKNRAKDLRQVPVQVLGGACEWYRQQYVDPPRYDEVGKIGRDAGLRSFEMAGLKPKDIDVLELYDINIFEVVRQLEVLGFCNEGEGIDFAFESGISEFGRLPINTDGGLLSFAHIGWGAPTLKIIEAVSQLRNQAISGQVPNAKTALVTGAGSGAQYHNVILLGKN